MELFLNTCEGKKVDAIVIGIVANTIYHGLEKQELSVMEAAALLIKNVQYFVDYQNQSFPGFDFEAMETAKNNGFTVNNYGEQFLLLELSKETRDEALDLIKDKLNGFKFTKFHVETSETDLYLMRKEGFAKENFIFFTK